MAASDSSVIRSEDELGKRWDKCLSDSVIKFGGGVAIGSILSLLFFKRRAWPIVFGAGSGFGISYSNCQHEFQKPYSSSAVSKKSVAPHPAVGLSSRY